MTLFQFNGLQTAKAVAMAATTTFHTRHIVRQQIFDYMLHAPLSVHTHTHIYAHFFSMPRTAFLLFTSFLALFFCFCFKHIHTEECAPFLLKLSRHLLHNQRTIRWEMKKREIKQNETNMKNILKNARTLYFRSHRCRI